MQAGKPVEEGDFNIQVGELRQGGAHLAAERSEEERSGAKWRGRGLGQRNIKIFREWWNHWDSNPRPLPCHGSVLAN